MLHAHVCMSNVNEPLALIKHVCACDIQEQLLITYYLLLITYHLLLVYLCTRIPVYLYTCITRIPVCLYTCIPV